MAIQTRAQTVDSGAVDITFDLDKNNMHMALLAVHVNFDTAPTTSESVMVTVKSVRGDDYDVVVANDDPSTDSTTSYLFTPPDYPLALEAGDKVQVEYTNTDNRKVSVLVKYSDMMY